MSGGSNNHPQRPKVVRVGGQCPDMSLGRHMCSRLTSDKSDENQSATECWLEGWFEDESGYTRDRIKQPKNVSSMKEFVKAACR